MYASVKMVDLVIHTQVFAQTIINSPEPGDKFARVLVTPNYRDVRTPARQTQ